MEFLSIFSAVFFLLLFGYCLATILTNYGRYKYYKSTYEKLVNKDFIFEYRTNLEGLNDIYTFTHKEKNTSLLSNDDDDSNILIFIKENDSISIKLSGGDLEYIHNGSLTYFDPYTLYWYLKFKIWFNNNKKDFTKTFNERFDEVFPKKVGG